MSQLTSLQTKVAGQILAAIASGDLQPGLHLKEVELAQRLGVSRSPIRSALAYLAEQKATEPLPQQGYRVPLETTEGLAQHFTELHNEEDELYTRLIDDRLNQVLPDQISESDLLRRYGVGKACCAAACCAFPTKA